MSRQFCNFFKIFTKDYNFNRFLIDYIINKQLKIPKFVNQYGVKTIVRAIIINWQQKKDLYGLLIFWRPEQGSASKHAQSSLVRIYIWTDAPCLVFPFPFKTFVLCGPQQVQILIINLHKKKTIIGL